MLDPFPKTLLLDATQVRTLLGMDRSTFGRWLKTDEAAGFPKPVPVGRGRTGKPLLKWKKLLVLAFIDSLGR